MNIKGSKYSPLIMLSNMLLWLSCREYAFVLAEVLECKNIMEVSLFLHPLSKYEDQLCARHHMRSWDSGWAREPEFSEHRPFCYLPQKCYICQKTNKRQTDVHISNVCHKEKQIWSYGSENAVYFPKFLLGYIWDIEKLLYCLQNKR